MIHLQSTAKPRRVRKYAQPAAKPQLRKYTVEVKQGADTTKLMPWYGPHDPDQGVESVIRELKAEGYVPLMVEWED